MVELLVVVAIIALLASIAVPALQRAMLKSKRNAAASDLRVLRDAMHQWASDQGRYPTLWEFDEKTLLPLNATYLPQREKILRHFQGRQLDWYFPWNILSDPLDPSWVYMPSGFTVWAILSHDPSVEFIITDTDLYYLDHGWLVQVGEERRPH